MKRIKIKVHVEKENSGKMSKFQPLRKFESFLGQIKQRPWPPCLDRKKSSVFEGGLFNDQDLIFM